MDGYVFLATFFAVTALGFRVGIAQWAGFLSPRIAVLVAASLFPLAIAALSLLLLLNAVTGSAASCGSEGCGMVMAIAYIGLAVALFGFGIGVIAVFLMSRLVDTW